MSIAQTIVEDTANQLYSVAPYDGLDHAWLGTPVKRVKGGFEIKANGKPRLIRKAGCRLVAGEGA